MPKTLLNDKEEETLRLILGASNDYLHNHSVLSLLGHDFIEFTGIGNGWKCTADGMFHIHSLRGKNERQ